MATKPTDRTTNRRRTALRRPKPKFYTTIFLIFFFLGLAVTGVYFIITDIRQSILRLL